MPSTAISIVVRDADGATVETFHDSASDKDFAQGGYSGARKAFATKKFDKNVTLAENHTLVLLVNGVAKLQHPEPTKGKKRAAGGTPKASKPAAKKAAVTAEKPKPSEAGWTPPADDKSAASPPKKTCAPSMLLSMKMKTGKPPVEVERKVHSPQVKPRKKKRVVAEAESDDESLPQQKRTDEDSEEEVDFDAPVEEAEEEVEEVVVEAPVLTTAKGAARAWSAFGEHETKPDTGDAQGDEWNQIDSDDEGCATVSVVKALNAKELAAKLDQAGLLLLESSKWILSQQALKTLKQAISARYAIKLKEAQEEGLVTKKRKDLLKLEETETIAGFNQRPGGRVDMVLDDLEAVQNFSWPWAPAIKAILGSSSSLNYVGCVVARPGDATQNWHIDGVHSVEERHARADRVIVFCPLTDLTKATGCTEFVPTSHFKSRGKYKFSQVVNMPRARHYIHAGTPLVMDYRLWHRGLPNTGTSDRYLLYCVYQTADSKKAIELTGGSKAALSSAVDGSRAW